MNRKDFFARALSAVTLLQWILVATLLVFTVPNSAEAQSAKPLNLGEIIQKNTPGNRPPRAYLKLPNSVPIPANNPLKAKTGAAPGQIAPGSINAQTPGQITPAAQQPASSTTAPKQPLETTPAPVELTAEPAAPAPPKIQAGGIARLQLTALLSDDGQLLQRGVNWRIFAEKRDANGRLETIQNIDGGSVAIELDPGSYIVYAGYGFANLTKRIVLDRAGDYSESFVLRAGAARLNAVAAGDIPLDSNILFFDIYTRQDSDGGSQQLIAKNVKANHVVKLSEGTYHIVSSYGAANAKVRGDIQIEAGKLVNVTMIHNAAKVTLRLVSEPGGEALANTIWTVLTPGGDVVKQAIGAFPTLALNAGDYTALAKQNDKVYNRDFSVDAGLDRDIEVLAQAQ